MISLYTLSLSLLSLLDLVEGVVGVWVKKYGIGTVFVCQEIEGDKG